MQFKDGYRNSVKSKFVFLLLLFDPQHWCSKPHMLQPLTCPVSMVFFFVLAANVHFLCTKLQVHFSQRAAHDQLYAANSDRDVLPWHASHIQASLHLHPTDGHPPQERYDHEEEGWFLTVSVQGVEERHWDTDIILIIRIQDVRSLFLVCYWMSAHIFNFFLINKLKWNELKTVWTPRVQFWWLF